MLTFNTEKIIGIVTSALTIVGFFIALFALPPEHKLVGVIGVILLSAVAVFTIGYIVGNRRRPTSRDLFSDTLLEFLEQLKNDGQDAEIIRFGIALSTPVWLSQKYELRKQIGNYVFQAAINQNDKHVKIKMLVDDLGWTNVELGLYDDALGLINRGITLAAECGDVYYQAKGSRHLCALSSRQGLLDQAQEFLDAAIAFTEVLNEDSRKSEMIAEIHFAKSSLAHKKNKLAEALAEIDIAYDKYASFIDREWRIKILARKGEIFISQGRIQEAMEIFLEGLDISRKCHFNKQIVKNLIGLGKCACRDNQLRKAQTYFDQAMNIAAKIGMFHEKRAIEQELVRIKSADMRP